MVSEKRKLTRRHRDQMAGPGEQVLPRRPDERDESATSQAEGVRDVVRQGAEDLEHGQQDTGRQPVMDRAYEQQKGEGTPGTEPAAPDRSGAGLRKT